MMAKPMKTLELHYPMIQFLIIYDKLNYTGILIGFTHVLSEGRCIDDINIDNNLLFYHMKQIDSMLP